ncbi:MAG TPA: PDZ domain-containing protein [Blastocatellia bacterium]|nr:PDZ domain-containing protein [Blastocatellia bacterium]
MTNCQGCGTEILRSDRFCKNCGAPVAASVEDLADTHRFDNTAPAVAGASPESFTASTTFPLMQASTPLSRSSSAIKNLLHRHLIWLIALVLVFVFIGGGTIIGRDAARARRAERAERAQRTEKATLARQARQAEAARLALEEAVQNAFGFVPASVSDLEYPDTRGIFVASLTSDDGPAALARMEAGDVLTELNDQPVRNSGELAKVLNSLKPGAEVKVKLYRDDEAVASKIRVGSQSVAPFQPQIEPRDQGFLGTGDVARRCCLPGTKKWGLEVHRVIDNSPADLAGLQLGDVITEFDKHTVRTPNELARRIHAAKPRSKVKVKYYRGGSEQTMELTLGHGW